MTEQDYEAQYEPQQQAPTSRAAVLLEAADEAESAAKLFPNTNECAAAMGALEGLAIRFRRMAAEVPSSTPAAVDRCTCRAATHQQHHIGAPVPGCPWCASEEQPQ